MKFGFERSFMVCDLYHLTNLGQAIINQQVMLPQLRNLRVLKVGKVNRNGRKRSVPSRRRGRRKVVKSSLVFCVCFTFPLLYCHLLQFLF